jgi:flavin reductase (DIM6/NTAB) family NADH-FMN oxidoreductase RutF
MTFNPTAIANVFAPLDRELWLLTSRSGARRGGLIATFVNQASIVPAMPRVAAGVARQHFTWELIEASGAFALHLLGEEHLEWVWHFALQSGRDVNKLANLAAVEKVTGSPVLADAVAWLDCRVEARLETGDRTVYLAEALAGDRVRSQPVLTFQRMLQLAPPDRLRRLKELMARDGLVDAEAIAAWRSMRRETQPKQEDGDEPRCEA